MWPGLLEALWTAMMDIITIYLGPLLYFTVFYSISHTFYLIYVLQFTSILLHFMSTSYCILRQYYISRKYCNGRQYIYNNTVNTIEVQVTQHVCDVLFFHTFVSVIVDKNKFHSVKYSNKRWYFRYTCMSYLLKITKGILLNTV